MTKDDKRQAVFGAADGLTSTVAIIIAQLISGGRHSLIAGGFAIAIAAGVGMGYSEWLSDTTASGRRALVMAVATLIASALPIVPFLFLWRASGVLAALVLAVGLTAGIVLIRASLTSESLRRAVLVTGGGIVLVSALVSIPSLLVG